MMKIITEIFKSPTGRLSSSLYATTDEKEFDIATNGTLINFIELLDPGLRTMVIDLLASHEAGTYHPEHPEWADFGINDINLWIREPFVEPGHVLIANENTSDYSEEYGTPQRFTVSQFRQVMAFWEEFLAMVAEKGKEALIGQKFEREIV